MKNLFNLMLLSVVLLSCVGKTEHREIFYADPTIFCENGIYYMSGTRNIEPLGFAMLKSTDLKTWERAASDSMNMVLMGDGKSTYGTKGFWAPQFLKENDKYYLTYTANEHVAIAEAKNLNDLYMQEDVRQIDNSDKNIDSYLYKDDDGKWYLYHVRFNNGNYIWVAEYDWATQSIKSETLKQCLTKTEDWEATDNYPWDPIMEGPTVIKMKGVYYLFYSANHFLNIDYAVGYATSSSPFGPWKKHKNSPIIHRSIVGENGAGHGDLFFDEQDKPYYIYHVHYNSEKVSPRRTRIVPLIFSFNQSTGIYDITVDTEKIVKPMTTEPLENIAKATDF